MKPKDAYESVEDFTKHLHAVNVAIAAGVPRLTVAFIESIESPHGKGRSITIVLAGDISESQARLVLAPAKLISDRLAKDFHAHHITDSDDSDQ